MPIKKQLDNGKTVTYKLKSIDSFIFMSTSLSILVNLSEGLHNDKCIYFKSYLDYMSVKDDQFVGVLSVKRIMRKILIKN